MFGAGGWWNAVGSEHILCAFDFVNAANATEAKTNRVGNHVLTDYGTAPTWNNSTGITFNPDYANGSGLNNSTLNGMYEDIKSVFVAWSGGVNCTLASFGHSVNSLEGSAFARTDNNGGANDSTNDVHFRAPGLVKSTTSMLVYQHTFGPGETTWVVLDGDRNIGKNVTTSSDHKDSAGVVGRVGNTKLFRNGEKLTTMEYAVNQDGNCFGEIPTFGQTSIATDIFNKAYNRIDPGEYSMYGVVAFDVALTDAEAQRLSLTMMQAFGL